MYFVNKRSLGLAFVLSVLLVICQNTEASSVKEESYVPANIEAGNNNKVHKSSSHRHDHKNDILKKNTEIIYGQEDDDDDEESDEAAPANNAAESSTSSPSVVAAAKQVPNTLDGAEFGLGFKNQNEKKSDDDSYDADSEKELIRLLGFQRYPQYQRDEESDIGDLMDAIEQEMAYEDYAKQNSYGSSEESSQDFLDALFQQTQEDSDDIRSDNDVKSIKPVNLVDVSENLMRESDYNKQLIKKDQNIEALDESIMPAAEVINSQSIKGNPSLALKQASHHHQDEELETSRVDLLRKQNDYLFIFIVGGCVIAGLVALIAASVCWYTVHKSSKTIILTDYGMKGGAASNLGGSKISLNSGDRRLAQSAQMYHYQHQKQQMIAMEKANNDTKPDNQSDSEGETEEGDYTVYECPGLAPTGEMEVKNPLFKEEFSSNNLQAAAAAATAPPAYSSVLSTTKEDQLIQIDQTSVTTVNETTKQQSTEQQN